jgi:Fe-S oxidoreductase
VNFNCSKDVLQGVREIADKCIDCRLCMKECIMLNDYCKSPKELFSQIKDEGKVDSKIPYSCSNCGKCTMVCPKDLRLGASFMDMRKEIVKQNKGKSPMKGHSAVENHQRFSFSKIFNTAIGDTKAGYTKRVFIPGCSLSSYSPYLIGKTLEFLQEKLPGTGAVLMCCGKPTKDLGQMDKFYERYSKLQREIDNLGAVEVITACQNCFLTISEHSSKLKVRSLWSVVPEIGLPAGLCGIGKNSDITFTIHDACPTRYNSEIHNGVRWIIKELGYKVEESPNSRERTNCCGFGGMILPAKPNLAKRVMSKSANEAKSDYVVTYCASCREAMVMGGKKSVHILNLMFNDKWDSSSDFPDLPDSFLKNWINRYKSKVEINKKKK